MHAVPTGTCHMYRLQRKIRPLYLGEVSFQREESKGEVGKELGGGGGEPFFVGRAQAQYHRRLGAKYDSCVQINVQPLQNLQKKLPYPFLSSNPRLYHFHHDGIHVNFFFITEHRILL